MACVPGAVVFGILGCVRDRQRLLATICTIISGALTLFWLIQIALSMG